MWPTNVSFHPWEVPAGGSSQSQPIPECTSLWLQTIFQRGHGTCKWRGVWSGKKIPQLKKRLQYMYSSCCCNLINEGGRGREKARGETSTHCVHIVYSPRHSGDSPHRLQLHLKKTKDERLEWKMNKTQGREHSKTQHKVGWLRLYASTKQCSLRSSW